MVNDIVEASYIRTLLKHILFIQYVAWDNVKAFSVVCSFTADRTKLLRENFAARGRIIKLINIYWTRILMENCRNITIRY